ncbi:hypothetical protein V6Z11_D03G061900 [Gossypium hirsutum]
MKNQFKFGLAILYLVWKLLDNPITTTNRVIGLCVRLKHHCMHDNVFLRRIKVLDDFGNVTNSKQFMRILELSLTIMKKNKGKCTRYLISPTKETTNCTTLDGKSSDISSNNKKKKGTNDTKL